MTFTEIVSDVMDRLNLSSTDATTRIGRFVNTRYKRITSSLGINTSRRGTVSAATTADTATLSLGLAKIELLYVTATAERRVLEERTFDELKARSVLDNITGAPREYAIQSHDDDGITVLLYPTPGDATTIYADGLLNASTLSGTNVPAFPADFHDVLIYGAMEDELRKMQQATLANMAKADYEQRLSDLRFFLAKSAYLSITQGDRGYRKLNPTNVKIVS